MRNNPNPELFSLYINGERASQHAYPLVTAATVFGMRAAWVKKNGKKVELRKVRKGSRF